MRTRRAFLQAAAGAAFLPAPARAAEQLHAFRAETSRLDLRLSQLFLDDTWIEETYRLERLWETADIFPEPVLRPETPWENRQVVMYGSVFHTGSEWRMYYMTFNSPAPSLLCLATSHDGVHWDRPKLGLFEFQGSKANNIVMFPEPDLHHDGPTVCHDPADSAAPYKMMYYAFGPNRPRGEYVAFSKDGASWQHRPEPVLTTTGDRTNLLASRDRDGKFVVYLRHRDMMSLHRARSVWRSESGDFLRWSEPEPVLRADLLEDPNTELYGMSVFPYGDLYLGMLERWYDNPDVIEVQLAWSYDGRDWHRPARRSALIGPAYPWNRAWNTCANTPPARQGNQLWFYFGGRSRAHGREAPESYGAIGLASVYADRFAAIRADFKEGLLLTRPMTWPGGDLIVNSTNTRYPRAHPSSGGGSVQVEVRDENNQPVPGFSGDQRADHSFPSPAPGQPEPRAVRWPSGRSMRELAGRRIRLAFLLRDARLYSFRAEG
ncbi:MAG TPA: hypothetical protein VEU62_23545 [Bryobacterales bacterium]|nr:hypothetical protein [Bryobacterales bacterium]